APPPWLRTRQRRARRLRALRPGCACRHRPALRSPRACPRAHPARPVRKPCGQPPNQLKVCWVTPFRASVTSPSTPLSSVAVGTGAVVVAGGGVVVVVAGGAVIVV